MRHAVPGLPLGVTTGYWALPDEKQRYGAVEAWTVLPDFASVNWHEPGAEELAELLLSRGVGVEAGIFHAEAAATWAASEFAPALHAGDDRTAGRRRYRQRADDLLSQVMAAGSPAPLLLHGLDESCWPLLEHAGRRGLQTRIGLEDALPATRWLVTVGKR